MAYRGALVDRAHILRKRKGTGRKVNGYTVQDETSPVEGPEFRARLEMNTSIENERDGRTSADPRPSLMTDFRDSDGNPLEFRISDRIRVVSRQLGTAVWEVDGMPDPIRKKRRVIGWDVPIHRVEETVAD